MNKVTMYGKPDCRDCLTAKKWLEENNIPYEYIDITTDTKIKEWIIGEGHRQVPQFYIGGELTIHGGWKAFKGIGVEEILRVLKG